MYAASLTILIVRLFRRSPFGPVLRAIQYTFWTLAVIGAICFAYAFYEPYRLTVEQTYIPSAKLPIGGGIRILHITDTHCESTPRLEQKIVEIAQKARPHLIVMTGDMTNSGEGIPIFHEFLNELADVAPVYAVRGNRDCLEWGERLCRNTRTHLLDGMDATVAVPGGKIWIAGAPWGESWWARQLAPRAPKNAVKLFLYHSPDGIEVAAGAGMDLTLVGHTHGGQVVLPGYGPLVTLSHSCKKYQRGMYKVGNMFAYVNRGIGMDEKIGRNVRFGSRPEVAIIDIVPSAVVRTASK